MHEAIALEAEETARGACAEIQPCGPAAIRVTGRGEDAETSWRTVHHLARVLASSRIPGHLGSIPTYESVLIEFDPLLTSASDMDDHVREALGHIDPDEPLTRSPRRFEVPVLYGESGGPDLARVAEVTGLTPDEVIECHSSARYTVRCLGAPGGSPMLDGPPFPRPIPRLESPRTSVPVGAVSVAGRQATMTPARAPGGWCVIGQSPLHVLDLREEPPVPYSPGDILRFRPITAREFEDRRGERLAPQEALG
jgi:KipI family sensor histidine kinase inhibitor